MLGVERRVLFADRLKRDFAEGAGRVIDNLAPRGPKSRLPWRLGRLKIETMRSRLDKIFREMSRETWKGTGRNSRSS